MWKQHLIETADLRLIIKNTENKLTQQLKVNKEQVIYYKYFNYKAQRIMKCIA